MDIHKKFKPVFTPLQMLKLGVFGGEYFTAEQMLEFPISWRIAHLSDRSPLPHENNAFGVLSGQSREIWIKKGWIKTDELGWFQWYCRYYQGRRCEDDERQIKRWLAFSRHSAQVKKNGGGLPWKRSVQRQALLQWAWDPLPDIEWVWGSLTGVKSQPSPIQKMKTWKKCNGLD